VYISGSFKALPSVISDLCGPKKPNAKEQQAALRHMDFLLRSQLLKVSLCFWPLRSLLLHMHELQGDLMTTKRCL